MFNLPNRITGDISQTFSDGYVEIYPTSRNSESAGRMPTVSIIEATAKKLRFAEQRVGINRYYSAKQVNVQIDRVVRIPRPTGKKFFTQDIVRINGNDDASYRIEQIQSVDNVNPKCLDLSLSRISFNPYSDGGEEW